MYQWLYKGSIDNGVMVLLEEVEKYQKDGYVFPEDLGKQGTEEAVDEESALEDMDKDDLELYARKMFDVEIDRRKSHKNIVRQIKALEEQ